MDTLSHYSNYFLGCNPEKWHTKIPNFNRIIYCDVYKDIDLQFYMNNGTIKYDFVIKPNANPSNIRIRYSGIDGLFVSENGYSISVSNGNSHTESNLLVYQVKNGKRYKIEGQYKIFDDSTFGFEISDYDKSGYLVIDPLVSIIYSTYFGGSSYESSNDVVVDNNNFAYVTGYTMSTNFPLQNPYQGYNAGSFDVFVCKFSATGNQLLYSTYLGGSSEDVAYGIGIDNAGNIYVTGRTSSSDFPIANAYQNQNSGGLYDVFIIKITASGTQLSYSTYLGGTDSEEGMDIVIDTSRAAYVVGRTSSIDFPLSNPYQPNYGGGYYDGFVTKFVFSGNQLSYSSYLGGNNDDAPYGIAVDLSGCAYITGNILSTNFPLMNPFQNFRNGPSDGFLTKLSVDNTGKMEIPSIEIPVSFNIHPNIASDIVNIEINVRKLQKVDFSFFDVNGRRVTETFSKNVLPGKTIIPWSIKEIPAGVYFIRMDCQGDYSMVHKFIKFK